jgi:hypothetical protein
MQSHEFKPQYRGEGGESVRKVEEMSKLENEGFSSLIRGMRHKQALKNAV